MKFLSIVLIASLVALSQQKRNKPQSENWEPDSWDAEPAPAPASQNNCDCPSDAVNEEFTPSVAVVVSFNTSLTCSSSSKLKQITYLGTRNLNITCNGVIVLTNDATYNATIGGGYGGKSTITLNLTNHKLIYTSSNGNLLVEECGTITGGKCSGDTFYGTRILEANDQNGCCEGGVTSATALAAQIQVKGKCASSCSLGSSSCTFSQPISNHGSGDRSNNV